MGAIMGGEATPAQIGGFLVALRLKGETADEIAGFAEAIRGRGAPRPPEADRSRRHRRHRRRRPGDDQHLDRGGARRRRGRRRRRQARQPRRLVGVRLGRRARGARLRARAAAGADRALDRRARLRLPLRADAPPGHAPRGPGAPRARDANRLQRARPADEPGRRARAGRRRLRPGARAHDRRGARAARLAPGVRRPRRGGIDELSPAGPNLVCEVVDGEVLEREIDPRDSASRAARRTSCGRHAGRERSRDPRGLLGRERGEARRGPAERRRGDRGGRPRGRPARGARDRARGGRLGSGRERLEALVAFSNDGQVPGRARRARPRGDRRGQAPVALGGGLRPGRAIRRRSPPRSARAAPRRSRCSSTSASAGPSTTCAPRARQRRAAARKGVLLARRRSCDELREAGADAALADPARPRRPHRARR